MALIDPRKDAKVDPPPLKSNMDAESKLNMIFDRFREASELHTSLHAIKFRLKNNLSISDPSKANSMKLVMEIAMEQIKKQRDEILQLGIKEYQTLNQNGK